MPTVLQNLIPSVSWHFKIRFMKRSVWVCFGSRVLLQAKSRMQTTLRQLKTLRDAPVCKHRLYKICLMFQSNTNSVFLCFFRAIPQNNNKKLFLWGQQLDHFGWTQLLFWLNFCFLIWHFSCPDLCFCPLYFLIRKYEPFSIPEWACPWSKC